MRCKFCKEEIPEGHIPFYEIESKSHYHTKCHLLVELMRDDPKKIREWLDEDNL